MLSGNFSLKRMSGGNGKQGCQLSCLKYEISMTYQLPSSGFSADGVRFSADGVRFEEMITSPALQETGNGGTVQGAQGRSQRSIADLCSLPCVRY